jgi:hypothetical protein
MHTHRWNAGTHAKLEPNEMYSVRELLYACMLPSGTHACMYRSFSKSIYRSLLTLSVRELLCANCCTPCCCPRERCNSAAYV